MNDHYCEYLNDLNYRYSESTITYDNNLKTWKYVHKRYADEMEVRMGEAEFVGEHVSSSEVEIIFCPFCGAKLKWFFCAHGSVCCLK